MSDDWDFYPLLVDDQRASIFVDLGIRQEAPIESHPTMAYLRVLMLRPRDDGLSSEEEFEDLIKLEDDVTAKIIQDGRAIFVGRNTSSGNRDFYFYTQDPARFEAAAREAMSGFAEYRYQTGSREDRCWRTYFEFLHPSEAEWQRIMNRRVCEVLEEQGDNLNNERKIDHFVYLPSQDAQSAFVRRVTREAFTVDNAPEQPDEEGQFGVGFSRQDRPSEIDEIVLQLLKDVTDLGGIYDGWSCPVTS